MSSKYWTGNSVVVPSHAAGVKIGVSARMKPRAVEEVADGVDHFVADAQDRLLPLRADPQVAAVHQVVDAVFLRRDGVVLRLRDDLERGDVHLEAARRARVGAGGAVDDDRALLREVIGGS